MIAVRLSDKDLSAIITTFRECFPASDHLWLFGSRADLTKKGGDIDLYIETTLKDVSMIFDTKMKFIFKLQERIGEQKIDIVIKYKEEDLPIHIIAQQKGVKLT